MVVVCLFARVCVGVERSRERVLRVEKRGFGFWPFPLLSNNLLFFSPYNYPLPPSTFHYLFSHGQPSLFSSHLCLLLPGKGTFFLSSHSFFFFFGFWELNCSWVLDVADHGRFETFSLVHYSGA